MKPSIGKVDESKLNEAAALLMECIPDHASELVGELAKDYSLPIWQIFVGVVLESHIRGTLSGFTVDPAWTEGLKKYSYVCKLCGKDFVPKQFGQQYCSNECGEGIVKDAGNNKLLSGASASSNPGSKLPSKPDLSKRLAELVRKSDADWAEGPLPA